MTPEQCVDLKDLALFLFFFGMFVGFVLGMGMSKK